jgi:preprotein translocase subunit SecE
MMELQQKKAGLGTRVRNFFSEVVVELKKSSWPTRRDLVDSTIIVVITMVLLGLFVALADVVLSRIVGWLTRV